MSNENENLLISREEKRQIESEKEYLGALEIFSTFDENTDPQILLQTAEKLITAITFKRSNPEPYICLAYIFYLLDQDELALEYLVTAKDFDSDNPRIGELYYLITGLEESENFILEEKTEETNKISRVAAENQGMSFGERVKLLKSTNLLSTSFNKKSED